MKCLSLLSRLTCSFALLLLAGHACAATPKAGDIVSSTKTLRGLDGQTVRYEIGTLYVPENRQNPGSHLIGVGFARITSPQAKPGTPPVFWLPGGPGLSVLGDFEGTSESAQSRVAMWLRFLPVSDVVIIEQRGYTARGDMLVADTPALSLDKVETPLAKVHKYEALAAAAKTKYADKDLAGYTISACADDVNDLRRALGYRQISLFGGSFGSQWSMATIRLHPQIVARAVLSGVEPLDNGYDMPSHVHAALQRIAYDADRDPALTPWMPKGGVMAAAQAVHDRLAAKPIQVAVRDEATGRAQTVTLGVGDFQQALVDGVADAEAWPAFILTLYHGHYDDWARDVLSGRQPNTIKLIGPLMDQSLGISAAREFQLRTDPALDAIGTWNFEPYLGSRAAWPTPDMGDALRLPVRTTTPVIFVHGDWDTSTPIENTLGLLPYFVNSRAILVHRGGHDGTFYLLRENNEAKAAIYRFLATGTMPDLPSRIELPTPAFTKPAFPPPVATAMVDAAQ